MADNDSQSSDAQSRARSGSESSDEDIPLGQPEAGDKRKADVIEIDDSSSSDSDAEANKPAAHVRPNKKAKGQNGAAKPAGKDSRGTFWGFTWNNPPGVGTKPDADLRWPEPLPEDVAGVKYSIEKGENGTVHFQFVIKLRKQMRFAAVKKMYPEVYLEAIRDIDAALNYVQKDETHIAGPFTVGEEVSKKQGKRTDLDAVKYAIKEGVSDANLYDDHFSTMARYPHLAHHARMAWASKALRDVKVEVLYGASGSGKSHLAYHENPDAYRKPDAGQWWDGYQVSIRISQPNMHNIYEE